MTTMFLIDVIVPFSVPFGLYVVRRRPGWFENVVVRLYADQLGGPVSGEIDAAKEKAEFLNLRYQELEGKNFDFAGSMYA